MGPDQDVKLEAEAYLERMVHLPCRPACFIRRFCHGKVGNGGEELGGNSRVGSLIKHL